MRFLDAEAVAALGPAAAVEAIEGALRNGLDPAQDLERTAADLKNGQFLLMPSEGPTAAGVKVVTVAANSVPRVQAVYLLFDRETLAPTAVLDGTALTTLRTPAVSVAAVRTRLPEHPRVAIFGRGPQAVGHANTLAAVRELESVAYLGRDDDQSVIDNADVIVCATTARTPLFDSRRIRDDAIVIAVGAHEPDARELDTELMRRATVIVEDPRTALREAGDVILAGLDEHDLVAMKDQSQARGPTVFKSVGMPWEDLVVAEAVLRIWG